MYRGGGGAHQKGKTNLRKVTVRYKATLKILLACQQLANCLSSDSSYHKTMGEKNAV